MGLRRYRRLLAVAAGLLMAMPAWATEVLRVTEAWIQEGPPSVPVLAGYLTLENTTNQEVRVTRVTSEIAERVEIHRTEITDTTATMRRIPELTLMPRAKLAFASGGYHLMIFGVGKPPGAGDRVNLELQLGSGDKVKARAEVRRVSAAP
ncbi:MAG: copper chaperone PCu(A)C [Chromatiales bacterium]